MPKRSTRTKADVADVKLAGTTVTVTTTSTKPPPAKRSIHERRQAPPVAKGPPVADATPSDSVTIDRARVKAPSTGRKGRG
jgi:hypothetical protein